MKAAELKIGDKLKIELLATTVVGNRFDGGNTITEKTVSSVRLDEECSRIYFTFKGSKTEYHNGMGVEKELLRIYRSSRFNNPVTYKVHY